MLIDRKLMANIPSTSSTIWLADKENDDRLEKMLILESLEVKMVREKDTDTVADLESFTWDMISFDKDFIKLQIEWVNPQNIGTFAS